MSLFLAQQDFPPKVHGNPPPLLNAPFGKLFGPGPPSLFGAALAKLFGLPFALVLGLRFGSLLGCLDVVVDGRVVDNVTER